MNDNIVITTNDYQRLTGLIELASLRSRIPEATSKLYRKLAVAKMLPQQKIDRGIITMNSKVLVRELNSGRETEITITYPDDAELRKRHVSVFSDIGIKLFGLKEGDTVSWEIPGGVGTFKILKVVYQPEAAGHYYL